MLFNSLEYIILLLISVPVYWLSSDQKKRQIILLIASLYFYMSWSEIFVILLAGMVLINWIIGKWLAKTFSPKVLWLGVSANLAVLCFFKYINFFIASILSLYGIVSQAAIPTEPFFSVILPLGISFLVFEFISYLVDIYNRKIEPEPNVVAFSLYVMFFPHLIAGPICRANQFIPQVKELLVFDFEKFYRGIYLFLLGFVLKVAIADGVAPYVNVIFNSPINYSGLDNFLAVMGFGVQIFSDFCGYSLMALGAALLFGISLPINFNSPYIAQSIQDFWRRWHITLSNWLRDYLYIPLGGSRASTNTKIQRNLLITMLLGGLWHGASWNFILWGAIHGVALVINRWWSDLHWSFKGQFLYKVAAWVLTMTVVFLAWIFFRAKSFALSMDLLKNIAMGDWLSTKLAPSFFELLAIFLVVHVIVHKTSFKKLDEIGVVRFVVCSVILSLLAIVYYVNGTDFIYFQF